MSGNGGDMQMGRRLLLCGGVLTALASMLHVAIVVGGADWYRFFGAGEGMARRAARGSLFPAVVTLSIAAVLGVWASYALSGAGLVRRLPLLRPMLAVTAVAFLARGLVGVPVVLLVDDPYTQELRTRLTFMIVTSAICICLGVCYAAGAISLAGRSTE